jgi:hypothetical protein
MTRTLGINSKNKHKILCPDVLSVTKSEILPHPYLSLKEKNAWISFKNFVKEFLGNKKDNQYQEIVPQFLQNYH